MKKFIVVGFMIFCVLISGCSRSKTFLSMKFQPGAVYRYTVSTTQALSQSMMGETMEMTQTFTRIYIFQVIDVDDQSIATIDIVFDEIGLESQGPFGSMIYRSWEHEGEIPQSVKPFTVLLGKHVAMKLSSEGRVLSISGTEAIIEEMIKVLGLEDDITMIENARKDLNNQFGNSAMIEALSKVFPVYPLRPISMGDAWGAEVRLSKGLPVILHNTWRANQVQDKEIILDAYGIIEPNPEVRFMNMPGTEMHYILRGQKNGRYTIDRETGWIKDGLVELYIEGVVAITGMVSGQMQSAQWPLQVTETIEIHSQQPQEDSTME